MTQSQMENTRKLEIDSSPAGNSGLSNVDRIQLMRESSGRVAGSPVQSSQSELDFSSSIYPQQPMLVADVIVHGSAPGQVPGHRSIEVTNSTLGRMNYSYATDNPVAPSFGTGRVYFDSDGLNGQVLERISLTPQQDRMVMEYIQNSGWDGTRYSLSNHNCQNFVNEVADFARGLRR